MVLMLLCLLAGCGGGNKINAPFRSSECEGKNIDNVVSELEQAGFTNIQTEPQESSVSFNDGSVIRVKIGSNSAYNTSNAWKPDVKIVIEYYEYTGEKKAELEPEKPEEEEPTGQTEAEKVYTADEGSLEEMARDLFSFEYEELSVSFDDFDEAYVVKYRPVKVLDVTAFVNQNVNRYIHFCQRAYEIEGLDRIRFDVQLLGQDQYGQDYEIEGLSEIMTEESFRKFNWDNLAYMEIWDAFCDECYYFGVAPEIVGDLDTTKVFYDPFTRDGKIV